MPSERLFEVTAVVIRCWSNPHVSNRVTDYLATGAGLVVVVINSAPDKGATRAWLKDITDPRLVILDMFMGYSRVGALNRAVMAIHMANLGGKELRFVLSASVEALFNQEHVLTMLREFADDKVGVVGTSFDARLKGNSVPVGRSYRHPRNTGTIIRLSALAATYGVFDHWCDHIGGMEDIHFILAMLALTSFQPRMLDSRSGSSSEPTTTKRRKKPASRMRWTRSSPSGAHSSLKACKNARALTTS